MAVLSDAALSARASAAVSGEAGGEVVVEHGAIAVDACAAGSEERAAGARTLKLSSLLPNAVNPKAVNPVAGLC